MQNASVKMEEEKLENANNLEKWGPYIQKYLDDEYGPDKYYIVMH